MENSFGALLRDWRSRRRFSQLELSLCANVSARHIAFLETARSKPSREMVIQLSEALNIPRAERNMLLNAAGFAPVYKRRDLDAAEMAHVRSAVAWTLERHDPFPAFALDRHWSLVMANDSATGLLAGAGLQVGDNMLEAATGSDSFRNAIENWPVVCRHLLARLRTESADLGGDAVLDAAADKLAREIPANAASEDANLQAVVPTRYRAGGITLSLFSTIAQFGTAEDIALVDLKIELMFPADDETRRVFMSAAATEP